MKSITAKIKNAYKTEQVQVTYTGKVFTPEEFTSIFMAILETYTEGLLEKNPRMEVYDHWNRTFGIFLGKIIGEEKKFEVSAPHKALKENIDATLGAPMSKETLEANENNRVAAAVLAREILIEAGLEEKSVDLLLNQKLIKGKSLNTPLIHEKH